MSVRTGVNGRAFSAARSTAKKVKLIYSNLFKLQSSLFQMPPCFVALGRLNLHFMPLCLCASSPAMLIAFHFSIHSRSFLHSNKINTIITQNHSRQSPNHSTPFAQELVSMEVLAFTWTAPVDNPLMRNPHLFLLVSRAMAKNGAEVKSTSELLKEDWYANLSLGCSAIVGSMTVAQNLLQKTDRFNRTQRRT